MDSGSHVSVAEETAMVLHAAASEITEEEWVLRGWQEAWHDFSRGRHVLEQQFLLFAE